LVDFKQTEIN